MQTRVLLASGVLIDLTSEPSPPRPCRYTQIFHIRDGKATEVWGMAENDAAVDPFLDGLPD